jgi:hypothetical protein
MGRALQGFRQRRAIEAAYDYTASLGRKGPRCAGQLEKAQKYVAGGEGEALELWSGA